MRVISLGWGVQSFTLAAMSALGDIEPVDVAIHADTLHEDARTYDFALRMTQWLEDHDVRVVTVKNPTGGIAKVLEKNQLMIPAYTLSKKRGKSGKLLRTCTQRWKIAPMRKWMQNNRVKREHVEQWLGISLDEVHRIRTSNVKYITNRYPLIEHRMTRRDCESWLTAHGLEIPPKSACVFCPFRDSEHWRDLGEMDKSFAVKVDERIRDMRDEHLTYLHPSRTPLSGVDFRSETERGQLSMWDDECAGVCGV